MVLTALVALLQAGAGGAPAPDSADAMIERVRAVQASYERVARRLAPAIFATGASGRCDERVGRFCLRHDPDESGPRRPERPVIANARAAVIDTLRRAFARFPGDRRIAGPLIQYLVQDGRADEAASAAGAFAVFSPDTLEAVLLRAFALHAAGRDSLAEPLFDAALRRMDARQRRHAEDVAVLLDPAERERYRALDDLGRRAYEALLWRLADPLYLTAANERRTEHFARRVWIRLLERRPSTAGVTAWGDDLAELTLRYGVPSQRARLVGRAMEDRGMVEWWDSTQLGFLPPAAGVEGVPSWRAGGDWWPDRPAARSQYSPATLRRLTRLEHRVTRFPDGASIRLRTDGRFVLDSLATGESVETGLFVVDSTGEIIARRRERIPARRDTLDFAFEIGLPPGDYVYSVEALERDSRLAGRARHSVELSSARADTLALSDLLLLEPLRQSPRPTRHPRPPELPGPAWSVTPHDTVALLVEAHNLRSAGAGVTGYRTEVAVRPVDDASLPVRAARWVGRRLGLLDAERRVRVGWDAEGDAGRPEIITLDLALGPLDPGIYTVEIAVTDRATGIRRTTSRRLRVEAAER